MEGVLCVPPDRNFLLRGGWKNRYVKLAKATTLVQPLNNNWSFPSLQSPTTATFPTAPGTATTTGSSSSTQSVQTARAIDDDDGVESWTLSVYKQKVRSYIILVETCAHNKLNQPFFFGKI